MIKEVVFLGDSSKVIRKFPHKARKKAATELDQLRMGADPLHWRPMPSVGSGVIELKISVREGQFRIFYVAKLDDAIFVLHAFTKKSQRTAKKDIDAGKRRYKELMQSRE